MAEPAPQDPPDVSKYLVPSSASPTGHSFAPGNPGRPAGVENKLTKTFKAALMATFHELGGVEHLTQWAKTNPTEFYKIAARLIPTEIVGPGPNGAHVIKTIVDEHRP